jgi:hypothetical protein
VDQIGETATEVKRDSAWKSLEGRTPKEKEWGTRIEAAIRELACPSVFASREGRKVELWRFGLSPGLPREECVNIKRTFSGIPTEQRLRVRLATSSSFLYGLARCYLLTFSEIPTSLPNLSTTLPPHNACMQHQREVSNVGADVATRAGGWRGVD